MLHKRRSLPGCEKPSARSSPVASMKPNKIAANLSNVDHVTIFEKGFLDTGSLKTLVPALKQLTYFAECEQGLTSEI